MENKIIDLGCLNYKPAPEVLKNCQDLKHELKRKEIHRCITEYTCEICGLKYNIDSGD